MYKVIWLVRFREDVPRDEVLRWWREEHGPLAAKTPGMLRYVQNHWTERLSTDDCLADPGGAPTYDGHAEHWFADRASYEAAMSTPEWQRTLEDGPRGFDHDTRIGGVLSEFVVLA